MATKSTIDLAYQFLSGKKKSITLSEIWEAVSKDIKVNKDPIDMMADLYGDLVVDNRFILTEAGEWTLPGQGNDIRKQYEHLLNEKQNKKTKLSLEEQVDEDIDDEIEEEEEDDDDSDLTFYDFDEEE